MTLRDRGRVIAALGGIAGLVFLALGIYLGITEGNWWLILIAAGAFLCSYLIYWDGKRKSPSNLGQPD